MCGRKLDEADLLFIGGYCVVSAGLAKEQSQSGLTNFMGRLGEM